MKTQTKGIICATLCVGLAAAVALNIPGQSAKAVSTSLPYIEQIVSNAAAGGQTFNILEIVPQSGTGSIGYYIAGAEPFADQNAALSKKSGKDDRKAVAAALFANLKKQNLMSTDASSTDAAPLTGSADSFYAEKMPWEMNGDEYASYRELNLANEENDTVKGTASEKSGGGYSEIVTYGGDKKDRVQIVDHFLYYIQDGTSLTNEDGYYFYAPVFTKLENGVTKSSGTAVYTNKFQPAALTGTPVDSDGKSWAADGVPFYEETGKGDSTHQSIYLVTDQSGSPMNQTAYESSKGHFYLKALTLVNSDTPEKPVYKDAGVPTVSFYANFIYYASWHDNIELDTAVTYYFVDDSDIGAPAASGSDASPYAAVSSDYRQIKTGETGYFSFDNKYRYVGLGQGNYTFQADPNSSTSCIIYTAKVYYKLNFTNNNWFLRYVLDRGSSYFSNTESRVSFNVSSVMPAAVTEQMAENADLIVLTSGSGASGGTAVPGYTSANGKFPDGIKDKIAELATESNGNATPVVLDLSLTENTDTEVNSLAAGLAGGKTSPFAGNSIFGYRSETSGSQTGLPLATEKFNTNISNLSENGYTSAAFADVLTEIKNENFLRKQAGSEDLFPETVTMATSVRHILNYKQHRKVTPKTAIRVLEIEPGKGKSLTADQVLGWLGAQSSLTADNITIDSMSTAEFIGKIDDLSETYDLVYIGDDTTGFNLSGGSTVYNDSAMNGLLYSSIGDLYKTNVRLAGMLNRDHVSSSSGAIDTHTIDAGVSGLNEFRLSGNDLTSTKAAALKAFATTGYPVVCADSLIEKKSVEEKDYTLTAVLNGKYPSDDDKTKVLFSADVRIRNSSGDAETIPNGSVITYTLAKPDGSTEQKSVTVSGSSTSCTFASVAAAAGSYSCTASVVDPGARAHGFTDGTSAASNTVKVTASGVSINNNYMSGGVAYSFAPSISCYYSNGNRYTIIAIPYATPDHSFTGASYKWYAGSVLIGSTQTLSLRSTDLSSYKNKTIKCEMTYAGIKASQSATLLFDKYDGYYFSYIKDTTFGSFTETSGVYTSVITGSETANGVRFVSSLSSNLSYPDYQWQQSADGSSFTDIADADNDVYTAAVPQNTTYYRLRTTGYFYDYGWNSVTLISNVAAVTKTPDGQFLFSSSGSGTAGTFVTTETVEGGVSKTAVDVNSNLYKALNEIRARDNVMSLKYVTDHTDTLLQCLNMSKPSIVWSDPKKDSSDTSYSYPAEYSLSDDGTMTGLSKSQDGSYTLSYTFTITNATEIDPTKTTYDCQLFIDLNSDGLYSADEEISDIVVYNHDDSDSRVYPNSSGKYLLKAGTAYTVTRRMPDNYAGFVAWKLKVVKNSDSTIHASQTNYTHITPSAGAAKTTINILQIASDASGALNLQTQMAASKSTSNSQLRSNDGTYYTGIYGKLLADVKDFNVTITTKTISSVNSYYSGASTDADCNVAKYNMLIIGFGDAYGIDKGSLSNQAAQAVLAFIQKGKAVLFTHDTTSLTNIEPDSTNYTYVKNTNGSKSSYTSTTADPWIWGYSFNTILRDAVSLDRYGITSAAKVNNTAISDTLKEIDNDSGSAKTAYQNELSAIAKDGYSIAYQPNSSETVTRYTQGYANYSLYRYGTGNSYTSACASNDSYRSTTNISQVNKGQITTYPYDINLAGFSTNPDTTDKTMQIGNTHEQYYQLNMNSDNIVVWYCLAANSSASSSAYYADLPNDVTNSYYIFSKGNITYSGVGHTSSQSLYTSTTNNSIAARYVNEAKLFVNTMIAAYRTTASAPSAAFTSSGSDSASTLSTYLVTTDGQQLGTSYPLHFRISDPSLNAKRTISLGFSYFATDKDGKAEDPVTADISTIYNEKGDSVSVYQGGNSYYVDLPADLLQKLMGANTDFITFTITVSTEGEDKTDSVTSAITIRKVDLFPLE